MVHNNFKLIFVVPRNFSVRTEEVKAYTYTWYHKPKTSDNLKLTNRFRGTLLDISNCLKLTEKNNSLIRTNYIQRKIIHA